jgi:hypothetical protein
MGVEMLLYGRDGHGGGRRRDGGGVCLWVLVCSVPVCPWQSLAVPFCPHGYASMLGWNWARLGSIRE